MRYVGDTRNRGLGPTAPPGDRTRGGDTALPAPTNIENEVPQLRGYQRAYEDGWLIRFETDGNGGLVEIREKYIGRYGLTKTKWQNLRKAKTKRDGLTAGNLARSSRKLGNQHLLLAKLAQYDGRGARAAKLSTQVDGSPRAVANWLYDLQAQGFVRYAPCYGKMKNGRARQYKLWHVNDNWQEFLPRALVLVVSTRPLTASEVGQLTGLGYEKVTATLAELARAGRVGRVRTDVGFLYFANGAKHDGD